MSSNAMRQLEERHVANKVELMVWCNKMDLLALSNVKGEVALHRLTWQKVWLLPPPKEGSLVKGISWRPDGKVLAIGYSTGEILLVDVENKDILHTSFVEGEISCLVWLQEKMEPSENANYSFSSFENQDDPFDFLPKLPSLRCSFGSTNEGVEENLEDSKKIKDQKHLNFLVIGFKDGRVSLSVFGLFPCGVIDIKDLLGGEDCSVLDADFTDNIESLFVVVKINTNEYKNRLKLLVLDTKILSLRGKELHTLALKHGHIICLLDYLSQTMHSITEAWENIFLLEIESKLASYANSLPAGSVAADFLELLMFGKSSDGLEKFLMHDLSDKGIKKLGHSIELSHSNIQKLILKHLLSVGNNIAYHLAELKGMAKFTDEFQAIGLNEETVVKAFLAAGSFLVKSTEVQLVIDDSMKKYKAFFRWLYGVILRMTDDRAPDITLNDVSQQDLKFIADYLHSLDKIGQIHHQNTSSKFCGYLDRLGQYLVNQDLTNLSDISNNPWQQLLEDNPCFTQHPIVIPKYKKMSLVQQHSHLKAAIEEVFKSPQNSIGSSFNLIKSIYLLDVGERQRLSMCHLPEDKTLTLGIIELDSVHNIFQFLEIPITETNNINVRNISVFFKSPDNVSMKALDIQFYLPETLSVLLEPHGENRSAIFVQIPTKSIRNRKEDILDGNSIVESNALRSVVDMVASRFAVSGSRKVAVVLSESRRKVRLFEMEVEEEEEEEDGMDGTLSSTKNSDNSNSVLDTSKVSEYD
uniref:Anaphase-promoting complex subunit 4 n=1 Tax=Clastoptera arizonana TaxID=38151 RepID=A0A1B6CIQ6_9HEMI